MTEIVRQYTPIFKRALCLMAGIHCQALGLQFTSRLILTLHIGPVNVRDDQKKEMV